MVTNGSWAVADGGWRVIDGGKALAFGTTEGLHSPTPRIDKKDGAIQEPCLMAALELTSLQRHGTVCKHACGDAM